MNRTLGYCLLIVIVAAGFLCPDTFLGAVAVDVTAMCLLKLIDHLIIDR